jgi:hypothetical protein
MMMIISYPPPIPTAKLNGSRCSANDAEYSDSLTVPVWLRYIELLMEHRETTVWFCHPDPFPFPFPFPMPQDKFV